LAALNAKKRLDQLLENMKFHKLKPEDIVVCRFGGGTGRCRSGIRAGIERLLTFLTRRLEYSRRDSLCATPVNAEFYSSAIPQSSGP